MSQIQAATCVLPPAHWEVHCLQVKKSVTETPRTIVFGGKSEPPALFLTWGYLTMGLNRQRFSFLPVELAK